MTTVVGRILWVVMAVAVIVYTIGALAPESPLYARLLTPRLLLAAASLIKLSFLLAATIWAFLCRDRLEPENPARQAWGLLSLGCLSTTAGQLSLAPYQIVQGTTPFPSVGDLYYVLAYPFFVAALSRFLRAYRETGLPIGSPAQRGTLLVATAVVAGLVAIPLLRPVVSSEGPWLERLINAAYLVFDLVLLVPLVLLLRIALRLRGGRVWRVWALLLGGFFFGCIADLLFAYFSLLGQAHLDAFLDPPYFLAYGLIAQGARRQRRLLTG